MRADRLSVSTIVGVAAAALLLVLDPVLAAGGDAPRGAAGDRNRDIQGSSGPDGAEVALRYEELFEAPPQEGSREAAEDPCEYRNDLFAPPITEAEQERIEEQNASVEVDEEAPRLRSTWRRCPGGDWELIMWWEQPGGGTDPVGPLIQEALAQVRPGPVPLVVQPPAQPGVLVGIPAYFSVDEGEASPPPATATDGVFSVTVSVAPTQLLIETGTGETLSCDPPGSRYQQGQPHPADGCTYLYTTVPDSGSHLVSSHLQYSASYSVSGPGFATTIELPAFDGPTTDTDVTIREVRAVRTR